MRPVYYPLPDDGGFDEHYVAYNAFMKAVHDGVEAARKYDPTLTHVSADRWHAFARACISSYSRSMSINTSN
jgi:hypothetical protein